MIFCCFFLRRLIANCSLFFIGSKNSGTIRLRFRVEGSLQEVLEEVAMVEQGCREEAAFLGRGVDSESGS